MSAKTKDSADSKKTQKDATPKSAEKPVKKEAPKKEASKEVAKKETLKVVAKVETEKVEPEKTICIIRIRGSPNIRQTISDTMKLFNLHHVNHATLVRTNPSVIGMLHKAKDYIAYGAIDLETLKKLLKKRGLLTGNKPLTDSHVKFATNFDSIDNLANGLFEGKTKLRDVPELKPIFRLHPPKGGFPGTIKRAVKAGGVLGNWGENINLLLKKML
jgi:large subunit ribosomal protein L30